MKAVLENVQLSRIQKADFLEYELKNIQHLASDISEEKHILEQYMQALATHKQEFLQNIPVSEVLHMNDTERV